MQINPDDNGESGLESILLGFVQGEANVTVNKQAASAGVSVADVSHGSAASTNPLPAWAQNPYVLGGLVVGTILAVVVIKKVID